MTAKPKMEVSITSRTKSEQSAGEVLQFRLKNADHSFANGLRRVMLSEIPTLAIDRVDIRVNTSVLNDEMISHRLGLVPLNSVRALELNELRDCECNGAGCHLCEVVMHLSARCSADQPSLRVYASNLVSDDPSVHPVSSTAEGVWLLTLGRAQEIDLRCVARRGIAKVHAKWMPVATVAMHYVPDIRLNKEGFARLDEGLQEQWTQRCPRKVFSYNKTSGTVQIDRLEDCIYCKECMSTEQPFNKLPAPLVSVRPLRNEFAQYEYVFNVESTGVLPVLSIVHQAVDVMRSKLINLRKALNALEKPSEPLVKPLPAKHNPFLEVPLGGPDVHDPDIIAKDDDFGAVFA